MKLFRTYCIRASRKTDPGKAVTLYVSGGSLQKGTLQSRRNRSKATAKKSNFRLLWNTGGSSKSTGFLYLFWCRRKGSTAYRMLITKAAPVRAAQMGHKQADVAMVHSPISSNASLAAICSASFLLCPCPLPITLLFIWTSTQNFLS